MEVNSKPVKIKQESENIKAYGKHSERKKRKNCWIAGCTTCCIVILIIILGLLVVVAATGVYEIPILSKCFYKELQPMREVDYTKDTIDNFNKRLDDIRQNKTGNLAFTITESELTALLDDKTRERGLEKIQTTITPDFIELYIKFQRSTKLVTIAEIIPLVEDNQIKFRIVRAKIGSFTISEKSLSSLSNLINQQISNVLSGENFQIVDIRLKDGEMVIYIILKQPVTFN